MQTMNSDEYDPNEPLVNKPINLPSEEEIYEQGQAINS